SRVEVHPVERTRPPRGEEVGERPHGDARLGVLDLRAREVTCEVLDRPTHLRVARHGRALHRGPPDVSGTRTAGQGEERPTPGLEPDCWAADASTRSAL